MSKIYTKKVWINDQTKLSAKNMNHIEDGIEAIAEALEAIDSSGAITDHHRHDNKVTLDKITEAFTTELKNKYDENSVVSVSAEGSSENTVQYITIDGTEYKLAGTSVDPTPDPEPTPTPVDPEIPYQELDSAALDMLATQGVYKINNATDAPNNTAKSGLLNVIKLTDGKVEQEWLSDTNRAVRIYSDSEVIENDFYVDGAKTDPVGGFIELQSGATYTLSGSLYGTIKVIGDETKYTTLNLSNVNIFSTNNSAIINSLDNKLIVEVLDNTTNYLTVNDQISIDISSIGALHSEGDLTVYGTGQLTIVSDRGHGIKATDISFGGYPKVYIDAYHDAIHGKSVRITEGKYYIKNSNDAISAGSTKNDGKILISGGEITIEKCRENAFQAKRADESILGSLIQVYGKAVLNFKDNFSLGAPFNATTVRLFPSITINNESSVVMPDFIDIATYYGSPKVTDGGGDTVEPSFGNTYQLNLADTYRLKGDFTGYKIVVTAKSTNLAFNNVYYNNTDELDNDPFIEYTPDGKRLELKLMNNTVNFIHKENGSCISSNKNFGINNADESGDLFLECPLGYGIYAPLGDTRILNDGARYIENCKVGVYANWLHLGEDDEDIDITKKKDSFIYIRNSETDVAVVARTASGGYHKPGRIIAPQNNYGISIIHKAIKPDTELSTDEMAIEAKIGNVQPLGSTFERQSTIYFKEAVNLENINATQFTNTLTDVALPLATSPIIGNAWKVYGNYADKSTVEGLVSTIINLNSIIADLTTRVEALEEGSVPVDTDAQLSPEGDLTLNHVEVDKDENLDLGNLATLTNDGSLIL